MKLIRTVLGLLSPDERRQAYVLLPLMVAMALFEVAGVASIAPFLTLLANPGASAGGGLLARIHQAFPVGDRTFTFLIGAGALATLLTTNALAAVTFHRLYRFGAHCNYSISRQLLENYLKQPYEFFVSRNTSSLENNIFQEVQQVVIGLVIPGLQAMAKGISALFLVAMLFAIRPIVALLITALLGGAYAAIYGGVRHRQDRLGEERVRANAARFQAAAEALGGIKELRLLGREREYVNQYEGPTLRFSRAEADTLNLAMLPRYALETIAFGGLLVVVLVLLGSGQSSSSALPVMGLYAFAGYRLLPALQIVFRGMSSVRYSIGPLNALTETMSEASTHVRVRQEQVEERSTKLTLRERITVQDVHFRYASASVPALRGISLEIQAGTSVAFVGTTGSGKSTLADTVLGLLQPQRGVVSIDGTSLNEVNARQWYPSIGYVPQTIFLADKSVAQNIALGVADDEIDMEAVLAAATVAHVHDFVINSLPDGYQTLIGERGIRLSGGQRQRLGIARALYHDPPVLVLDESTSALDMETERRLFKRLNASAKGKTIIMVAHRIATVESCDEIFVIGDGKVQAHGTFDELLARSQIFNKLARGTLRSA